MLRAWVTWMILRTPLRSEDRRGEDLGRPCWQQAEKKCVVLADELKRLVLKV